MPVDAYINPANKKIFRENFHRLMRPILEVKGIKLD